jgi:hypothetical protein
VTVVVFVPVVPVVVTVVTVVPGGSSAWPALINPAKVAKPAAKADLRTKSRRPRDFRDSGVDGISGFMG